MKIDVPLKPPEFVRDSLGRFDRPGATLRKTQQIKKPKKTKKREDGLFQEGGKAGPGRPPGALNKTTVALKQAILDALEAAGGEEGSVGYLKRLAVENSSAFAGLVSKILPSTLAADADSHGGVEMTFRRVIVWPGGREEVEGVTPKALPAPDTSHTLPGNSPSDSEPSDIK